MKILKKRNNIRYSFNLQLCQIHSIRYHDSAILDFSRIPRSFYSKLQQTNTKKQKTTRCLSLYTFTFVWNCSLTAHCIRFGGN